MWLHRESPAGVRFFSSLKSGRGLKPSARAAGVGMGPALRWLQEAFVSLRDVGLTVVEAQAVLGFSSSRMPGWEQDRLRAGDGRHHLRCDAEVEAAFWAAFDSGATWSAAARHAGVGRSTAHRWLRRRFVTLRENGTSMRAAGRPLRLGPERATAWEAERRRARATAVRAEAAAARAAARASYEHVRRLVEPRARPKAAEREERYWQLMREGLDNNAACRILGVDRHTGTNIRRRGERQTIATGREAAWSGRYLSLLERLQIADLLRLGASMRAVATELGRSPSTIKRELDRHRDEHGEYQPHQADHAAEQQRQRPRDTKLAGDNRLRSLVQRKLNRYWSPQQIAGWLRATHPGDASRNLCTETIYRALLVPGVRCLHTRYAAKLRTGRRLRRSRFLTRSRTGGAVRNMTMIKDRPAEVEARVQTGHWEGDLIIGRGSLSAMITLRERVTHYGLIVNLPVDHTARTVNVALIDVFATMPAPLARTLTWDQGTEMARHHDLASTTGLSVYFAERSSPWQRGANENFNGLVRQYFPKNTDLSVHSPEHVSAVTAELNDRPRKSLGYQTPTARFRAAARAA